MAAYTTLPVIGAAVVSIFTVPAEAIGWLLEPSMTAKVRKLRKRNVQVELLLEFSWRPGL